MTSRKHMIVGMTKGGLVSTHFSPRNLLLVATHPFGDIVVSIVVFSQIFKPRALFGPTIQLDR
jgi:hypothetical protein